MRSFQSHKFPVGRGQEMNACISEKIAGVQEVVIQLQNE